MTHIKLSDKQLEDFRAGTLIHCNEPVVWESCDLHRTDDTDCLLALCAGGCEGAWCDTLEFGSLVRCNNCDKTWVENEYFQVYSCDVCNSENYLMVLDN